MIRTVFALFCAVILWLSPRADELKVGDEFPDIRITRVLRDSVYHDHVRGRAKVVIFDFWATWCSNCIAEMPKLATLQDKYGPDILIVPVTVQDTAKAVSFWESNGITKGLDLPIMVNDTVISKLFPHQSVPHVVWIGPDGKVSGITGSEYLNDRNIDLLLHGEEVSWPVKRSLDHTHDKRERMYHARFSEFEGGNTYYTAVMPFWEGVSKQSVNFGNADEGWKKLAFVNYPILELYAVSLIGSPLHGLRNRIVLKTNDSSRFVYSSRWGYRDVWDLKNSYCYELSVPGSLPDSMLYRSMRGDLDRFLALSSRFAAEELECWVLKTVDIDLLQRKADSYSGDNTRQTVYRSIGDFVSAMNQQKNVLPVLDETGIERPIFLTKRGNVPWNDLERIKGLLADYGLSITKEVRRITVLVVSD